jgi:8-oxo-dGTP diphosphatase
MKPKPFQLSSKVLILDAEGRVLLLRRSQSSTYHPGAWEFPGGKTDPGETFDQALLREVAEETGLTISLHRVLGAGESDLPERKVAYLFLEARQLNGTVRLSEEHDAFVWIAPSELPRQDLAPQFKELARAYAGQAARSDSAEHLR